MDDPVGYLCRTPMNLFRKRFGEFCWHSAGLSVSRQRGMTLLMPMIVMRFGGCFRRYRHVGGSGTTASAVDPGFRGLYRSVRKVTAASRVSGWIEFASVMSAAGCAALCPLSGTTVPNGTSPTSMGSGSHGSVKSPAWLPSCATTRPQARRSESGTDPCTADGMCDSSPSADGSSAQDGARRDASGSRPGAPGVSGARAGTASRRSKGANQLWRSEASTSSIGRRQRSDPSAGLRVSS
jgi:hypothetical protein